MQQSYVVDVSQFATTEHIASVCRQRYTLRRGVFAGFSKWLFGSVDRWGILLLQAHLGFGKEQFDGSLMLGIGFRLLVGFY